MNKLEQIREAERRLKYLINEKGLNSKALEAIQNKKTMIILPDNYNEKIKDIIEDIKERYEESTDCFVYYILVEDYITRNTNICLFDISPYKEDWKYEDLALKQGCPIVYVHNIDNDLYNERGAIEIKINDGRIERIG